MRETTVEGRLKREVETRGGKCKKWVCPGSSGEPDRIVLMPGGWVAFVETKAPGKKLEPLQKKRRAELEALGCRVYCVDSLEAVTRFALEVLDGI